MVFTKGENSIRLKVHGVTSVSGLLLAINATGSRSQVEGVAAMLRSKKTTHVQVVGSKLAEDQFFSNGAYGYRTELHCLSRDVWQVIAVSKDSRVMLGDDNEILWNKLSSDQYTTPVLREWVPFIRSNLSTSMYDAAKTVGVCPSGGLLRLTTKNLDGIVIKGLCTGKIKIK
ncbi:hypothetical protein KC887_00475 [Candidatus Kaiserbacteria bacterium]|nr:hypothetical protein [Candidatus Kaiserbacteria bacterium]